MGSGPSAADAGLDAVCGRARVIAINDSWRLAPWADALYACDGAWWRANRGASGFSGLKLTQDTEAGVAFKLTTLQLRHRDDLQIGEPGIIGSGGNSGFQALNVAIGFGARRIVLVGYDMRIDRGLHWHGPHIAGLNNPAEHSVIRWRRVLDEAASCLRALGVSVVNASPLSTLTAYPKATLVDALAC